MRVILIFYCLFFVSCLGSHPNKVKLPDNQFVNNQTCLVQLAFKARLLKMPSYFSKDNTLAKLDRNEMVYVVGYERGFAKVKYNGLEGFISDQYFKDNIFYATWKEQYFMTFND